MSHSGSRTRIPRVGLGILVLLLLALAGWQLHAQGGSPALSGGLAGPSGAPHPNTGPSTAPLPVATGPGMLTGSDYHHDVSPPLRDIPPVSWPGNKQGEANERPPVIVRGH